jgi:hypothetical protein
MPPPMMMRPSMSHQFAFSPDGNLLVAADIIDPEAVRVWDPKSQRFVRKLATKGMEAIQFLFSPEGRFLAAMGPAVEVTRHGNATSTRQTGGMKLFVWDAKTGRRK